MALTFQRASLPRGVNERADMAKFGIEREGTPRSLYWYCRESIEAARNDARTYAKGTPQRKAAITDLGLLANEALGEWRAAKGEPMAFARYASEREAVEALLTLHAGRAAIDASAAMRTNQSRKATFAVGRRSPSRGGHEPSDGLPRDVVKAKVMVMRAKDPPVSFGLIAKRLGVSKTTVQRWAA